MKFEVDPALFEDASAARAREWVLALAELNSEEVAGDQVATLCRRHDGGVDLRVETGEADVTTLSLSYRRLRRHFRDYGDVIDQLARAVSGARGSRDMEILDYAKKLVHDDAADVVQRALAGTIELDQRRARRLFTLIFLLTNELPAALVGHHGH